MVSLTLQERIKEPFFGARSRVVLTLLLIFLGFFLHDQIMQMDGRFFQPSLSGIKGLILYEVGDLSGAADAYRAHFQDAYRTERTAADPGWDALLRADFDAAEAYSKKALEKNPADREALLNLGEIALLRGDPLQTLAFSDRVLQNETDQYDALLLSSVAHARLGNYKTSVDILKRGLRYSRVESRITSFLTVLKETGDLADLPKKSKPLALLAHYYRYLRIFDHANGRAAVRYAKEAIASGDQIDDAHLTWGIVFEKEDKPEKAFFHYLKAIESNPKNADAHRRAGNIYSDRGDLLNEYRMRKAAFEAERDPFYFNHFIDFLTEKMGDYHQALILSKNLLEANPTNVWVLHWVAYLYGYVGEPEQSIKYYEKAILMEPQNPKFYHGMGISLSELGRKEEAIAAYLRAVSLDPQRPGPHFELALLYREQRRYRDAINEYEEGFLLGNGKIHLRANLCILYYQVSEFQRSSDCFKHVLSVDPRNKTAQHLLPYVLTNLRKASQK